VALVGLTPRGWLVAPLRRFISRIEQGWSPQCDSRPASEGEWGIAKTGLVNGGRFRANEHKALPEGVEALKEYELQPGDFLVSRANTTQLVGSAGVVPPTVRERLLLCDKLFRVTFEHGRVDPHFLARAFGTAYIRTQLELDATGASSSMQNIGQDSLRRLIVALPPIDEQQAIAAYLDAETAAIDELADATRQSIELLKEYRTALISAAVTGQIDVSSMATPGESA